MKKYKVGILEDDKDLLKDLVETLKGSDEYEPILYERQSESFLEKARALPLDCIVLDINLQNDTKSGIDVARLLKIPTIFLSGNIKNNIEIIKDLEYNNESPIDFIMKGSDSNIIKGLKKFKIELDDYFAKQKIFLNLKEEGKQVIQIHTIAAIVSDKNHKHNPMDKVIYFNNRKPAYIETNFEVILKDINKNNNFLIIHKSYCINTDCIVNYSNRTFYIPCSDFSGKMTTMEFPLPDEPKPELRAELRKRGYLK